MDFYFSLVVGCPPYMVDQIRVTGPSWHQISLSDVGKLRRS